MLVAGDAMLDEYWFGDTARISPEAPVPVVRTHTAEHVVRAAFAQRFERPPVHVARAPGRLELLGNHTDYNDGLVLAAAIDRELAIAIAPRTDRLRVRGAASGGT